MARIAVMGSGSWGTAFVMVLADAGADVTLWGLDVEVADEVGRVITDRLDDQYFELTLDGVLLASDSIPGNGSQITYAGRQYITKSIEDKGTNKDFRKVSVKAVKYQEIA